MTPHRRDQVESIVEAMRAIHPSDWPAMLQKHWSHDVELHLELLSLLESNEKPTSRTGKLIRCPIDLDTIQSLAGAALGSYHILQLTRETATSVLYLAYDAGDPFKASIALKLIKPHLNTAHIARQFETEAPVLKQLHHPCIPRLFGGGVTREGMLYFASEFVSGRPLDAYCDAHRLPIIARLKLFGDLCDAVSYAHAHLVTHGSLDTDHIIVTANGLVRILDAGIARLINHEATTAPRNAGNDLLALGALLYELLSGLKPEQGAETLPSVALGNLENQQESSITICQARSISPGKLRQKLAGELDLICMRCLHPDPIHRYRSVDALYADIQRYLTGLPVEAHPDRLGYRAKKFVLRNLTGLALTVAGVCLLLALAVYYGLRFI